MKKLIVLIFGFLPFVCFAQNSCFTNCMNFQSNNPNGGAICSTNCSGGGSSGGYGPTAMDSFNSGYNSMNQVTQSQKQNEMINRARVDCNNGVAAGCDYLKRNNAY